MFDQALWDAINSHDGLLGVLTLIFSGVK